MSNAPNGTTGSKLGQNVAQPNGIPPPPFELRVPDTHDVVTENILKLNTLIENPRHKFLMNKLVEHLHAFARETRRVLLPSAIDMDAAFDSNATSSTIQFRLTTAEWQSTIKFLTRTGQTCTPLRQEFILLSDVLGLSAVVDNLNHPSDDTKSLPHGKLRATDHTVLGPFFTEDAADVLLGESIASEGKGEYLFVEGRVLDTDGKPVPNAVIETWETDENGFYDTQYADREHPDCRGRLRSDAEGRYSFRAVVPVPYPIPGDGPVGELLLALNRHNMRPAHIHFMVTAPKMETLVTAIYPEGDTYLTNDAVFGVKRSLVVHFDDVSDLAEGRKRGIPEGKPFKLLQFDIVLKKEDEGIEQPKSHL